MHLCSIVGTLMIFLFMLSGCDPATTHKITSTIFDGVPSLPPAEQYCQEFHEKKVVEEAEAAKKRQMVVTTATGSIHPPYAEKLCDNCHDKSKESGLILPKTELCFACHSKDLIQGAFAHGPAVVGSCLECHDPHKSLYPNLRKHPNGQLCATCHKEQRLAPKMHQLAASKELGCTNCHDPHSGPVRYFLK